MLANKHIFGTMIRTRLDSFPPARYQRAILKSRVGQNMKVCHARNSEIGKLIDFTASFCVTQRAIIFVNQILDFLPTLIGENLSQFSLQTSTSTRDDRDEKEREREITISFFSCPPSPSLYFSWSHLFHTLTYLDSCPLPPKKTSWFGRIQSEIFQLWSSLYLWDCHKSPCQEG